ncbi:MAG: hypothetical protein ACO3CG_07915 [Ilumatobacteraceae bacterium]
MRRIEVAAAPPADVAVLTRNLELWPVLREVVKDYSVLELETIKTPLNLRDAMRVLRHVVVDKASVGYASMAARLHRSGVKVLLAVDQTVEVVEELGRLLPDLRQVVTTHGSIRVDNLAHLRIRRRNHRVLCVWGRSDADLYKKSSNENKSVRCEIVGSLRNAGYLRIYPLSPARVAQTPLLFVSQYSGPDEEDLSSTTKRSALLRLVKAHLRTYCIAHDLPLKIALRPAASAPLAPGQSANERRHYEQVFSGVRLSFTEPTDTYASYRASDDSDITVGVPTGALTESFARGNKVLMVRQDPRTGSHYGFPVDGDWVLTEPTYEQFAAQLDKLRSMNRQDAANAWSREREYMVANAESDDPIRLVRSLLDRAIWGEI